MQVAHVGGHCEGIFCKHQIVIFFMATDVTQEDVIDYCGTWYTFMCGGLIAIFANPKHILDSLDFKNDVKLIVMKGSSILV
jgi:hypothetical protein